MPARARGAGAASGTPRAWSACASCWPARWARSSSATRCWCRSRPLLLLSGGGGSLDGSFAIAVPMWLAAHQIPVEVEGRPLGVLPLLPTVVVVVVVAARRRLVGATAGRPDPARRGPGRRRSGRCGRGRRGAGRRAAARRRLGDHAVGVDGRRPGCWPGSPPERACCGSAGCRRVDACAARLAARRAARGARAARGRAAGCPGRSSWCWALACRAGAVADSFAGLAPGRGRRARACCCSPSATCRTRWSRAWPGSLGPGFAVGAAEYGPFGTEAGPLPPFPLFAAVPPEPVPGWAAVVLVLPVAAGVVAGLVCRRALGADAPLRERVSAAAAGAGATAAGAGIVAAVAGGSLAGGPYDPVYLSPIGVLVTAFFLLGVPATIAAVGVDELLGRPPSARRPAGDRTRAPSRREGASARGERGEGKGRPERSGTGSGRDRADRERADRERAEQGRAEQGRADRDRSGTRPSGTAARSRRAPGRTSPAVAPGPSATARPVPDAGRRTAPGRRRSAPPRPVTSRTARSARSARGRGPRPDDAGRPGPPRARRRATRPRTVGDLVAQQESVREADAPAGRKPDAGPSDTDGGHSDAGDTADR